MPSLVKDDPLEMILPLISSPLPPEEPPLFEMAIATAVLLMVLASTMVPLDKFVAIPTKEFDTSFESIVPVELTVKIPIPDAPVISETVLFVMFAWLGFRLNK